MHWAICSMPAYEPPALRRRGVSGASSYDGGPAGVNPAARMRGVCAAMAAVPPFAPLQMHV